MNIRDYLYFKTLCEEKNITRASEKLFISQPALSTYLKRLENNFGDLLFIRDKNGLTITELGIKYMSFLQESKKLEDNFYKSLKHNNNNKVMEYPDVINFGITPWISTETINIIDKTFTEYFKNIELNFMEFEENILKDLYLRGKLDSFISTNLIFDEIPKNTNYIKLEIDNINLIVPKSILNDINMTYERYDNVYSPYKINVSLLKNQTIISTNKTQTLNLYINNLINHYDLRPKKMKYFSDFNNILSFVNSGHGITFMPKTYINNGPKLTNCAYFIDDNEYLKYSKIFIYKNTKYRLFYENFGNMLRLIFRKMHKHNYCL